jgi:hypothetical protein
MPAEAGVLWAIALFLTGMGFGVWLAHFINWVQAHRLRSKQRTTHTKGE